MYIKTRGSGKKIMQTNMYVHVQKRTPGHRKCALILNTHQITDTYL